ncbi:putative ankyrin repeat protein [Stylophora pistillata]|uniref:Putative ankyrin repeat protein n=1 Tax=Stylophora pistillata TaxID=50429 RepID=A0A2B4S0J0_STYPI|nr:putative ankyrin repeat protein [Stylophora pistillata]
MNSQIMAQARQPDVTSIDMSGKLLKAVMADDYDEVRNLLERGANPNFVTSNLTDGTATPFHSSVRRNKVNIVRCMLEYGADVNLVDEDGDSPLFSAVYKSTDPEIRNCLLENGANANHVNNAGNTALLHMLEGYVLEGLEFDLEAVFLLLDMCSNLEQHSSSGRSLIHFVSAIHLFDERCNSPNHRCLQFLAKLIDRGVSVDKKDTTGATVLHALASVACIEGIQFVSDSTTMVDATARDIKGQTALHKLCGKPYSVDFANCLNWLLLHGCHVNEEDCYGRTALHYATSSQFTNVSTVQALINKGANVKAVDKAGLNPLHMCVLPTVLVPVMEEEDEFPAKAGVCDVIQLLASAGLDVNTTDNADFSPLHFALREKDVAVITKLLQLGADVTLKTRTGETALHRSTIDYETFEAFMRFDKHDNLNVNIQDKFHSTPLHWAIWYHEVLVVRKLLEFGSSLSIKDNMGNTPCDIARLLEDTIILEELGILDEISYLRDVTGVNKEGIMDAHAAPDLLEIDTALHCAGLFSPSAHSGPLQESCETDTTESHNTIERFAHSSAKIKTREKTQSDTNVTSVTMNKNEEKKNQADSSLAVRDDEHSPADVSSHVTVHENQDTASENSPSWETCSSADSVVFVVERECSGKTDMYPDCPILREIDHQGRSVMFREWTEHLVEHRGPLNHYAKRFVLDCRDMGLCPDNMENTDIAAAIHDTITNAASKVAQLNPLLKCDVSLSGSWAEGTKIGFPNEFDYKWTLINFNDSFIPEEAETHPLGYTKLRLRESEAFDHNLTRYVDTDGFLDSRNLIRDLYTTINDAIFSGGIIASESLYLRKHLKVDKGSISKLAFRWVGTLFKDLLIEVDIVPAIKPSVWTPRCIEVNHSGLITSPKESKTSIVLKTPSPRLVKNWNAHFRISVSEYEAQILQNIPLPVLRGYILLKSLKDTLYMPQIYDHDQIDGLMEATISTYMLKTCFLHELKAAKDTCDPTLELARDSKSDEVSITWARRIIERMELSIERSELKSFFVPGVNLLVNHSMTVVNDQYILEAECNYQEVL